MAKLLSALLLLLPLVFNCHAKCLVEPDKGNVVSSQLEGTWGLDLALTTNLWPTIEVNGTVSFSSDPTILQNVPQEDCQFLEEYQVFMAGTYVVFMNGVEESHPFALINVSGNPHILYWRERDGDMFGDTESFNVMMARAKDKANDLFFWGGDFNNQPFVAFKRI